MSATPASALPLDLDQSRQLQTAVAGLTPQQLQWVSGYVAGLAAANGASASTELQALPAVVPVADGERLTVLYGSQTGNGEEVATTLAEQASARGFATRVLSLADYKPANLKRESLLTLIVSTHGEGDPPDDAELFHEYLMSDKAPQLASLRYSVLALGDSSYVNFCQTGREFDARLDELGAQRFEALVECDLDYDDRAGAWSDRVLNEIGDLLEINDAQALPKLRAVESVSAFDKSNPFPAEVLSNQKITGASSSKDVRHIELSIEGSGLTYEPGDSLAVLASNPPQLVEQMLAALEFEAAETVVVNDKSRRLSEALANDLEITAINLTFLRAWAGKTSDEHLASVLSADSQSLTAFVDNHQIIDVIRQFPAAVTSQDFVDMLRRLSPRSYSISSSLAANPDEVHLTVAAIRYDAYGSEHWGAASTHLVDRLQEGDKVSVFVERNSRFRLPAEHVPVVMIGPGTGVAPFRAFVEERVEKGATGDNWLIFGDRNFDSDFLYQLEWLRHVKQGNLQRLDVAFSRDQTKKVYVQDRIRENAAELYRWIESGAAIYVCGDAKRMAGDVDEAIVEVLRKHDGGDEDRARQALKELRAAGRYQRDVY